MTWNSKGICAAGMVVIMATPFQLLTAQQFSFQNSGFQTSFFAPAWYSLPSWDAEPVFGLAKKQAHSSIKKKIQNSFIKIT